MDTKEKRYQSISLRLDNYYLLERTLILCLPGFCYSNCLFLVQPCCRNVQLACLGPLREQWCLPGYLSSQIKCQAHGAISLVNKRPMSHTNWYLPWGWNMGIYSETMPFAGVDSKACWLSYSMKADIRQTQVTPQPDFCCACAVKAIHPDWDRSLTLLEKRGQGKNTELVTEYHLFVCEHLENNILGTS